MLCKALPGDWIKYAFVLHNLYSAKIVFWIPEYPPPWHRLGMGYWLNCVTPGRASWVLRLRFAALRITVELRTATTGGLPLRDIYAHGTHGRSVQSGVYGEAELFERFDLTEGYLFKNRVDFLAQAVKALAGES